MGRLKKFISCLVTGLFALVVAVLQWGGRLMDLLEFPEAARTISNWSETFKADDWAVLTIFLFTIIMIWIIIKPSKPQPEQSEPEGAKSRHKNTFIKIPGSKDATLKDNILFGEGIFLDAPNTEGLKAEGNIRFDPTTSPINQKVERDVWLLNAVHYIAFGSWEFTEINLNEANWTAGHDAQMEIKQMAFDGRLPVWGIIGSGELFKPIPKEYWEHHYLKGLIFVINDPEGFCTEVDGLASDHTIYNSLKASKAKVEELWPATKMAQDFVDIEYAVKHVAKFINPGIDFGSIHISNDYGPPCTLITEKLRSGELIARGKRTETTYEGGRQVHRPHSTDSNRVFDKKDWEYRELIPISSMVPHSEHPQTKSFKSGEDQTQLTALKVDFNQVKKLWPLSKS